MINGVYRVVVVFHRRRLLWACLSPTKQAVIAVIIVSSAVCRHVIVPTANICAKNHNRIKYCVDNIKIRPAVFNTRPQGEELIY